MNFTWYHNLSSREQKFVSIGSIFLLIIFFYFLMIKPILDNLEQLQNEVNKNQSLVIWMKQTVPLLQQKRSFNNTLRQKISSDTAMGEIEQTLKNENLNQSLKQITKSDSGNISLQFESIHFDSFIQWLIGFDASYQMMVTQINVTPTKQSGVVNISLQLRFESAT